MTFGHVMGIPAEESVVALGPAGVAVVTGAALIARAKVARIAAWLRRR